MPSHPDRVRRNYPESSFSNQDERRTERGSGTAATRDEDSNTPDVRPPVPGTPERVRSDA